MTSKTTTRSQSKQVANRILEIYRSSKFRTTTAGRKVRWDEPGEGDTPEVRQHNAYLAKQNQKQTDAKQRLKSKGIVPTKDSKPILEHPQKLDEDLYRVLSTFRTLYQSNRTMNFRTWAKVVAKILEDLD